MPTFVNTNFHRCYVEGEDGLLVRILSGEEVSATGAYADRLEATPGLKAKGSDEAKEFGAANEALASHGGASVGGRDVSEMSKKELRAYADELGLDVPKNARVDTLRDAISDASGDSGTVTTGDTPSE